MERLDLFSLAEWRRRGGVAVFRRPGIAEEAAAEERPWLGEGASGRVLSTGEQRPEPAALALRRRLADAGGAVPDEVQDELELLGRLVTGIAVQDRLRWHCGGSGALRTDLEGRRLSGAAWRPGEEPVAFASPVELAIEALGDGPALVATVEAPPARPIETRVPEGLAVLFVSMPFGPLYQPSIGLSLVAAALRRERPGIECALAYLTLEAADRLGPSLYTWIAEGEPQVVTLLGEWLFAEALHRQAAPPAAGYLQEVLVPQLGGRGRHRTLRAVLERLRRRLPDWIDGVADAIVRRRPKVVALSSVFQQQAASLALARALKRRSPEIKTLLGGANAEGEMGVEAVGAFGDALDAAVSGEGEPVVAAVVDALLDGARPPLPGVAWAGGRSTAGPPAPRRVSSMDDLPIPDYGDYFAQWRRAGGPGEPRLLVELSRGCWWGEKAHCTFCGLNGAGMRFRSKSPRRALAELEELAARHPGRPFLVVDNILDMGYFRTLLPELAARGREYDLFFEVKANLSKAQVRQLGAAGIRRIQPGIESLSDQVLGLMRKGVRAIHNVQLLKWCSELGVRPLWNLLWGFPGEDPEEYERMAAMMPGLSHLPPPGGAGRVRIDRFSPSFDEPRAMGFGVPRPVPAYRHVHPFPGGRLARLAYYFEADHADGGDPAGYGHRTATAVEAWRSAHPKSRLAAAERDGATLVVDTRPLPTPRVVRLTGLARRALGGLDGARTAASLARRLGSEEGGVRQALAELVERRLVLELGGRYLALTLPMAAGEDAESSSGEGRYHRAPPAAAAGRRPIPAIDRDRR